MKMSRFIDAKKIAGTRGDWRDCFQAGQRQPNQKAAERLYKMVTKLGMEIVPDYTEELYEESPTLKSAFCRLAHLIPHIYYIAQTGVAQYITKNYTGLSEENYQMCCKYYFYGMLSVPCADANNSPLP